MSFQEKSAYRFTKRKKKEGGGRHRHSIVNPAYKRQKMTCSLTQKARAFEKLVIVARFETGKTY
jgi:hypothetical protein